MALRMDEGSQLSVVARYHAALLLSRSGQFESALEILMRFAEQGRDKPDFMEAAGLAAMRKPLLPTELPRPRPKRNLRIWWQPTPTCRTCTICMGRSCY